MQTTLRPYQWDAVTHLCSQIASGSKSLGLNCPTGSGKTLIIAATLLKAGRAHIRGAVVAAPSLQTEANFARDYDLVADPKSIDFSTSIVRLTSTANQLFFQARHQSANQTHMLHTILSGTVTRNPPEAWVFLTTHALLTRRGFRGIPIDLTGCLLVVDEAHRAGIGQDSQKIGLFMEEWRRRGGLTLYVTATPFRTDRNQVLPAETIPYTWTIMQHAGSNYAPNDFQVESIPIKGVGSGSVADLEGDDLPDGEDTRRDLYEAMVNRWITDGKPKAVFIVPSKNSTQWATSLEAALRAVEARGRIINVVGSGRHAATHLSEILEPEQKVTRYDDSTVAAIIACRRFDEGTDWPLCSHVYCYGISRSFRLIIQRWGRAFRDKKHIDGYPARHINSAHISFFVREVAPDVFKQFEQAHHDHAFLLACYMADWEVSRDIAGEIRVRLEKHWARRPMTSVDRIRIDQATLVSDYVRATVVCKIEQFKVDFMAKTRGRTPTIGEIQDHLDGQHLSPAESLAVVQVLIVDVALRDETIPERLSNELTALDAMNQEMVLTAFRNVIRAYRGQTSSSTTSDKVTSFISTFTGQNAGDIVALLVKDIDLDMTNAEVVERLINPFWAKYQLFPTTSCGPQDVSEFLGTSIPTSVHDVEKMLKKRGLSIGTLVTCKDWVIGPPIDVDALRAKFRPHMRRLGSRIRQAQDPSQWSYVTVVERSKRMFNLKRYFGIDENLVELAMAARFGWRGLPVGGNLTDLLTGS